MSLLTSNLIQDMHSRIPFIQFDAFGPSLLDISFFYHFYDSLMPFFCWDFCHLKTKPPSLLWASHHHYICLTHSIPQDSIFHSSQSCIHLWKNNPAHKTHLPFLTNRFKGSDLIDRIPEELWVEIHNIVQEAVIKTIPKKKKCKKAKWLSEA